MSLTTSTVEHPSRIDRVAAMRKAGWTVAEIVTRLNIPVKQVYLLMQRHAARERGRLTSQSRTVLVPREMLDRLTPHAKERGITVNELARRIIEQVAEDGIVDAVLDDAE